MRHITLRNSTSGLVASVFGLIAAAGLLVAGNAESKDSLEVRLQKAEDRLAIEQLMMGDYPKALDSRDWKAYAALFTEDGELVQGTTVTTGPKAIEELFSRPRTPRPRPQQAGNAASDAPAAPRTPSITKHIVTDLNLKINGNTATATAYWQTVSTRDGKTTIAGAGHYNDVLKKVNGQWKFKHREIVNPLRDARAAPAATPSP